MLSEVRVQIRTLADIVSARKRGRELAAQIGFSHSNLTLIATAISEVTRNIVEFATRGEVIISVIRNGTKQGVKIIVSDQGPGIADVTKVMRDGFSTGQGLGIGLPGTKRLMDEFEITSKVGKGTVITMKKWSA
jgi:serine/threonine-protein kinase RsbT